jgi:hypothetical protein
MLLPSKLAEIVSKGILSNSLREWEMLGVRSGLFPVGDFNISGADS